MNPIGIYYAYWTESWDADVLPVVPRVETRGRDVLEVNAGTVACLSDADRGRRTGAMPCTRPHEQQGKGGRE